MNRFWHRHDCHNADGTRNLAGENMASARCCWEDWSGPIVTDDDNDPDGWMECGNVCAIELDSGESSYHYCAPIRITDVREEGVEGVIRYDEGCHCAPHYNGKRVLVPWDGVWPPTDRLWALYYAAVVAEAIEAGETCACGGIPAHAYGNGVECAACREARLTPPKPEKPARKKAEKKAKKTSK